MMSLINRLFPGLRLEEATLEVRVNIKNISFFGRDKVSIYLYIIISKDVILFNKKVRKRILILAYQLQKNSKGTTLNEII